MHDAFVATMVNTLRTGLRISRINSTACLDRACASGESHVLLVWHEEGLYKVHTGRFVIAINLHTFIHLSRLLVLFACIYLLLYQKKSYIDKLSDVLCMKSNNDQEFYKLLPS